ncbi:MAG: DNA repair protein RecO [Candidatus Doudnabacteria bacterium]|nr:DNA repair protein RecO [Candidatus Doudnabacteria bacterium]
MPQEQTRLAIILKKQPYNEGDELITVFTREAGKLRALAKSVKLQKAKLQSRLQQLFLVNLELTSAKLPKIIGVESRATFLKMRDNLAAVKMAYYASELILKFTPDEQKNEALFDLLAEFLKFLDSESKQPVLDLALAKFKINILRTLGLDISYPAGAKFFSNSHGGFVAGQSQDSRPVTLPTLDLFISLKDCRFDYLVSLNFGDQVLLENLQNLLSQFVEYQLERPVKSERYLKHG